MTAKRTYPSLTDKVVTPHTLRHAAAMALLQRDVDLSVIALWLGHESTETTEMYLHANMRMKDEGTRAGPRDQLRCRSESVSRARPATGLSGRL